MEANEEVMRSPMLGALLREVAAKLEQLATDGTPGHVDLCRLPLPPGGLEALRAWLGCGEAEATVNALAITTIQETGLAGVWWIRHCRTAGDVLSEYLEIAHSPKLLAADPQDVYLAVEKLRSRLDSIG